MRRRFLVKELQILSVLSVLSFSLSGCKTPGAAPDPAERLGAALALNDTEEFRAVEIDPKEVKVLKSWARYAAAQAQENRVTFSEEGGKRMIEVFQKAARVMEHDSPNFLGEQKAQDGLQKLVAKTIVLAKEDSAESKASIKKGTVNASMERLCPLWPFCR